MRPCGLWFPTPILVDQIRKASPISEVFVLNTPTKHPVAAHKYMSEEEKAAQLEAEKQAATQTDEGDGGQAAAPADVDKQEESPYAKQLKELQDREKELKEQLEKKDALIVNKNRAIEALKKQPAESEDDITEKILKRLEGKQTEQAIQSKINALTGDSAEREVILRHYKDSIVKSGNVDEDLKSAIALANRDQIWETRRNRALEERHEDFVTSFAGTSLRGETPKSNSQDPILRQAEEIVRSINPEAVKYLGKN